MSGVMKRGARWAVRGLIMAFLIVGGTQVLLYFNILGDSFPSKVLITFASFIIASILLWAAARPTRPIQPI